MTCKIGSFTDAPPLTEVRHAAQFASPEPAHAGRNVFPVSLCRRKSSASTRHAHINHLQIWRSTSLQKTRTCSASEFVSEIPGFFTPCRLTCNDRGRGSDWREENHVSSTGCHAPPAAEAGAQRAGEASDLSAVVDWRAVPASGGGALGGGRDDGDADPSGRQGGRAECVGAVAAGPARRRPARSRAWCGAGGDRPVGGDRQGAGDRARRVAGKIALGLVGDVPARVHADVKRALLGLIEQAVQGGWTCGRACRLLGLGERRARGWQARAAAGLLEDRRPGAAVHGLRPQEIDAILALAREWGEIDAPHRKLAHRGSYLGRVWLSPSTVLRVLLAYGQALPFRPARQRSVKRPWPDWVDYKPLQVWGYDFSAFTAAQTSALAILDLVSRKWIDTMLCPEATDVQVQALFIRALEAEGLLQLILDLADHHDDDDDDDEQQRLPVLLIVSDNGAQMTSGSTREFMALHALATHYGTGGPARRPIRRTSKASGVTSSTTGPTSRR